MENLTRPGPKAGVAADTAAAARDYLEKCGVIQMLGDVFGPGRVRFSTRFSQHVTLESGNYDGRLRSSRTCAKAILRRLMDLIKQHHAQNPPPQISMLKNTGVDNKPF